MAICLPPLPITEAMFTSSSAAEPGTGETAWTSGATFAAGEKAILGSPTSTVTMSIAAPGVITWSANGLPDGTPVKFTTTGALPTGLTAGTLYYVVNRATNTFQVSETPDGAPITTTGSQSGTHTGTAQVHRIYESQVGSNTGNPPAIDDGSKWVDVGPTNKWAVVDQLRNTRTWSASPYTITLTPGQRIDSIFLGKLVADTYRIAVTVGGDTVYDTDVTSLSSREVADWYDFFFMPFTVRESVLKLDLPPYTSAVITVTLTRASGLVGIGALDIGTFVYLGRAQHGAEADSRNFSKIDRDEFGNATLIPRRNVPTASVEIWFDKARAKSLIDLRDALDAKPAVWSALDQDDLGYFEPLLIRGIHTRFTVNAAYPQDGKLSATFEEV
jgi:hypothetical protein